MPSTMAFSVPLPGQRQASVSVLFLVTFFTLLSGTLPQDLEDGRQRFCNASVTEELLTECTWPCSNVSACSVGTEFVSYQDCEVPAWQKALYEGSFNVTSSEQDEDNSTAVSFEDDFDELINATACQTLCSKVIPVPQCCPGYFGAQCYECPRGAGGEHDICSSHGVCSDGMDGDGSCQCHDNFTGVACELCKNVRMFGINCSQECLCVNGYCDDGPAGTGACRLCLPGFQGRLCDEEIITCHNLMCANHSRCEQVGGHAQCVCDPGYEGQPDNVTACTPVNVCEKNASRVCDGGRLCVYTGPGRFKCRCPDGHRDDGVTCHPINPCNYNNGGCDVQTSVCMFLEANMSTCDCLAYYQNYVEGKGCSLVDVCPSAKCHRNANCSTVGPNQYRCTCLPGYVGDGKINCFGNILDRLEELNREHPLLKTQLTQSIALLDSVFKTALTQKGPFTIFVPNSRAFRKLRRYLPFSALLASPWKARKVMFQHILPGAMTLEDLQNYDSFYTLQGNLAELQVRVAKGVFKYRLRGQAAKAKVIVRDLPASNGVIHVVNEMLTNEPAISGDGTKTAMDLIRQEGRFNRMQSLIRTLALEAAFEQDNITVFAPENGGLDSLPEGTLDYLMTEEAGKAKLTTLLQNHIFPGRIPVTDLVSLKRIRSMANYSFDVSLGDRGRIQLNRKVSVSQANIPCLNAAYYHIDGPLIPEQLADILPSRCDFVRNTTVQGRCEPCRPDMKCPKETDIFQGTIAGCNFWGQTESWTSQPGCKAICLRSFRIPKCCSGFYGKDCLPCPGGHKNPMRGTRRGWRRNQGHLR